MSKKKTILLVEDDESFRTSLKRLFKKEALGILEAASGKEGMDLLSREKIDLILLDFYLGDMTGFDFLGLTRARSRPPVIVLTAFGDHAIQSDVLARGALRCLTKPVKRDELMSVVTRTLECGL